MAHPSQAFTGEGRATVADKLGAAVSLGECISVVVASLIDHKAILTTEEQATLPTIGANVEMWVRDLQEIHQEWMGADQL